MKKLLIALALAGFVCSDIQAAAPARLGNISSRLFIAPGQNATVGFVVGSPMQVLVRSVGPGLSGFKVNDGVPDTQLQLYSINNGNAKLIGSNAGWNGDAAIQKSADQVGAFPLGIGSKDSALLVTLQPGNYTAVCSSPSGATGEALVEAYCIDQTSGNIDVPKGYFPNLSILTTITAGHTATIGLIGSGFGNLIVLFRAVGPELANFGIPNPLPNPTIQVYDSKGNLQMQDEDWSSPTLAPGNESVGTLQTAFASVGAFPLTVGSRSAVLEYSMVLTGTNSTTVVISGNGGSGQVLGELYVY